MAPAASPRPPNRSEVDPPRRGDSDDDSDEQGGPDESGRGGSKAHPETYGPLDIKRYVKDDGRALILYARRESEGG